MYIARAVDERLTYWKTSRTRCPLILRGARQVGKSATITHFGKQFESLVVLDFELTPELINVFEGSLDPNHILKQLEVMAGRAITPGKTLVFFDEIQECPRAITSLRYFKEKLPKLHVVAAGSLLEFALGAISFPVGRVEYEFLYPLSFREFLTGTGRTQLASFLPQPILSQLSPPVAMAKTLNAALREYMVVGGMPEAVAVYAETQSLVETAKIHDRIVRSFRDDIPKYVSGDLQTANISNLFARLPRFCGQQVTYTKLHDDDPKRNKLSINLLRQAFIVHFVSAASPASLPLGASANENSFKPIFLDIGLAQRLCGRMPTEVINSREIVSAFDGQLAEQFVGQQLLALSSGSESGSLYYWKRHEKSSSAEVDYLLSRDGNIIPLEVKNGKSGSLKSLHLLLKTYPNVKRAICLQDTDKITTSENIWFAPLYSEL